MKTDFYWIRSCILSCTTIFQHEACDKLIKLFRQKYMYDAGMMDDYFSLADELENKKQPVSNSATITYMPSGEISRHDETHLNELT